MTKKPPPRRMPSREPRDTGDGPLGALPSWARVAAWVGFPVAAAAFLLWFIVSIQSAQLGRIEASLQEQSKANASVASHLAAETEQSWTLVGLMQRICINTAKNDADRMACVVTMGRGGGR